MLTISLLADHPNAIPLLAAAFRAEWPDYYAGGTLDDIAHDFTLQVQRDTIPIRLVAHFDGALAGTIVLRSSPLQTSPDHRPVIGGLFVYPQFRGQGAGSALVLAGMETAQNLGIPTIYTESATAAGIFLRLGWNRIGTSGHNGVECGVYKYIF